MSRRPHWIEARKAIPVSVKTEAWEDADGRCQGCGVTLGEGEYHYDHVKPVALGGTNDAENVQLLCFDCHARKTAEDIERIAKADRQGRRSGRQREGKRKGWKPSRPMPGTKASGWKKPLNGKPERRS